MHSCINCCSVPRSFGAGRSCWDSWSWGTSPARCCSCWGSSALDVGRMKALDGKHQRRWPGGCLARRDRPSWAAGQAGRRRQRWCRWLTTGSSLLPAQSWFFPSLPPPLPPPAWKVPFAGEISFPSACLGALLLPHCFPCKREGGGPSGS